MFVRAKDKPTAMARAIAARELHPALDMPSLRSCGRLDPVLATPHWATLGAVGIRNQARPKPSLQRLGAAPESAHQKML